jgi:hypothetical protein
MIVNFTQEGIPTPSRFRMILDDESLMVIQIKRIMHQEKLKDAARNYFYIFNCESVIDDRLRNYEIKYDIMNCKWYLYKM